MRRMKRTSGMYKYLAEQGLFDKGPEALAQGKKDYRRLYLSLHKKQHRRKNSEHTITCKPAEEQLLAGSAKMHGMNVAEYIRLAALAYSSKKYLSPRLEAVHSVLQNIMYARTQIERIRQEKKGLFSKSRDEQIESILQSVEGMVRKSFWEPPDLEAVVADAAQSNPVLTERLRKILVR